MNIIEELYFQRHGGESFDIVAKEFGLSLVLPPERKPPAREIPVFNARSDTMRVVHNRLGKARPNVEEIARPPR